MGMYATKHTAGGSLSIDMSWLKKHDYLCGYRSGVIKWTWGFGGESSISFSVNVMNESPDIRFQYSTKRWSDEEKKSMDYSFPFVRVPCNLGGGFRWAFQCGLWKNNCYCGRKVYTLYKANSDYFGCRKCIGIVYESQRESRSRHVFLGKIIDAERKAGKIEESIRKWHYQGKPTKKVLKLRRLQDQIPPVEYFDKVFRATFS